MKILLPRCRKKCLVIIGNSIESWIVSLVTFSRKVNKMDYKISIIIRTYNESKHIEEVLKSLLKQSYRNFEVILVDSESTDNTVETAEKYDVRIIKIKKKDFNYSYSSNIGCEKATGDLLCFLSGHSVVANDDYLILANNIFQNQEIGGCYGDVVALVDGSWIEKLFNYLGYIKNKVKGTEIKLESQIHPGILSCSNALVRKTLWDKHKFKEELGKGGEDVELAYRIIQEGYYVAKAPALLVKHSHGSGFIKFIKEFNGWRAMYDVVLKYIETNK
ncbi:hypothetical protein DIC82_09500 [Clostridium beijerinckii]|nr:hypothetical protein DIC82_09500 [Clostridium beijerinckii]